jgi:hypothetical protein
MWTPNAGVVASRDCLDDYLRTELPAGQQRSGNRDRLVDVVLKAVDAGERVVTVAPCQYTGERASGVLVITSERLHIADQREPGHADQNVSWPLAEIVQVTEHSSVGLRLFPSTDLELSLAGQTILVRNLTADQARRAATDLQEAIDWHRTQQSDRTQATATKHAFICYARIDSGHAKWLQQRLEAAGIPVWRDLISLQPGDDWQMKVRQAIATDAMVFLACFSQASLDREKAYQNEELRQAIEQWRQRLPGRRWLIPVRFDDCDIFNLHGGVFASLHQADLFGSDREQNAERLMKTIRSIFRPG